MIVATQPLTGQRGTRPLAPFVSFVLLLQYPPHFVSPPPVAVSQQRRIPLRVQPHFAPPIRTPIGRDFSIGTILSKCSLQIVGALVSTIYINTFIARFLMIATQSLTGQRGTRRSFPSSHSSSSFSTPHPSFPSPSLSSPVAASQLGISHGTLHSTVRKGPMRHQITSNHPADKPPSTIHSGWTAKLQYPSPFSIHVGDEDLLRHPIHSIPVFGATCVRLLSAF